MSYLRRIVCILSVAGLFLSGYAVVADFSGYTIVCDPADQVESFQSGTELPVTYHYDQKGNLKAGPGSLIVNYDYENRPAAIERDGIVSAYSYNGLGDRVLRCVGDECSREIPDYGNGLKNTLMEITGEGVVQRYYLWGAGLIGHVDVEPGSGKETVTYYHDDEMGSTLALTDEEGKVTDTYAYTPYGEVSTHEGATEISYLYNGGLGVRHEGDGIYHMKARYYSAKLKRFLSRDPFGLEGGHNLYAFANDNPISFADPFGLCPESYSSDVYDWGFDYKPSSGFQIQTSLPGSQYSASSASPLYAYDPSDSYRFPSASSYTMAENWGDDNTAWLISENWGDDNTAWLISSSIHSEQEVKSELSVLNEIGWKYEGDNPLIREAYLAARAKRLQDPNREVIVNRAPINSSEAIYDFLKMIPYEKRNEISRITAHWGDNYSPASDKFISSFSEDANLNDIIALSKVLYYIHGETGGTFEFSRKDCFEYGYGLFSSAYSFGRYGNGYIELPREGRELGTITHELMHHIQYLVDQTKHINPVSDQDWRNIAVSYKVPEQENRIQKTKQLYKMVNTINEAFKLTFYEAENESDKSLERYLKAPDRYGEKTGRIELPVWRAINTLGIESNRDRLDEHYQRMRR